MLDQPRIGMLYSSELTQLVLNRTCGQFLTFREAQKASDRRDSDSFSLHLFNKADTTTSSPKELA